MDFSAYGQTKLCNHFIFQNYLFPIKTFLHGDLHVYSYRSFIHISLTRWQISIRTPAKQWSSNYRCPFVASLIASVVIRSTFLVTIISAHLVKSLVILFSFVHLVINRILFFKNISVWKLTHQNSASTCHFQVLLCEYIRQERMEDILPISYLSK